MPVRESHRRPIAGRDRGLMCIGRPSRGRSRPSQGGSASEAQAVGLCKGDGTAWRRAWGGPAATANAHQPLDSEDPTHADIPLAHDRGSPHRRSRRSHSEAAALARRLRAPPDPRPGRRGGPAHRRRSARPPLPRASGRGVETHFAAAFRRTRLRLDYRRRTCAATSCATSVGVVPTAIPAASSASFFACAVPDEPEMIAPAWPIVFPGGAEKPAM